MILEILSILLLSRSKSKKLNLPRGIRCFIIRSEVIYNVKCNAVIIKREINSALENCFFFGGGRGGRGEAGRAGQFSLEPDFLEKRNALCLL